MLTRLTKIREYLLIAYNKAGFVIIPLVRFAVAFLTFYGIVDMVGGDSRFSGIAVMLLMSVVCAVLPSGFTVFAAMLFSLIHILSLSMVMAALTFAAYLIMYCLLVRFAPKYAIVAVLVPLFGKFGLHYAVPIVLGCIASPVALLPMICGVFVYGMSDAVKAASAREVGKNLDLIIQLCKDVLDVVLANKPMFAMMAVFTLVFVTVYVVRRFSFDYSLYVSVAAGVTVNVVGFLVAGLGFHYDVNIGRMLLMSLISGVLGVAFEFMKRALDYNRAEYCSFEDEDYYYFVKAVPKINMKTARRDPLSVADDSVRNFDTAYMDTGRVRAAEARPVEKPAERRSFFDRLKNSSGKKTQKSGAAGRTDKSDKSAGKSDVTEEYDESDLKGDD